MGAYCSVHNNTSETMYIKYGPNMAALQWASIAAAIAGTLVTLGAAAPAAVAAVGATEAGIIVTGGVMALTTAGLQIAHSEFDKELKKAGYSPIQPGGTYKSEKLTCSLLLQANIVLVGDKGSRCGSLTCWTGPTDNSCNAYNASEASYEFKPF